ncbi:hypothetical protein AcW1_009492 [Taiwanofungus camphoratus]|nr:hypothetical protein AcV7_006913 [Antrodia cinnamomea]KAI0947832.1 hypothetical protein AcW1_009492 [Antrodia cinnamomea]
MPDSLHFRGQSADTEMHELNQEADFLDQKTTVPATTNKTHAKLDRHNSDPDAQAMVIESLRSQIQDLFSQVSQLNNKLVKSYDRMSDLEDELHVTSTNLRQSTLKVSDLEFERSQHLSALSTGLLVEKDHVTTELTRLMEKATEEAARRGQAESARAEIEKELDDLSAGLFNQANSMVAEARIAEAVSNRKAQETERALREAEEVVGLLQEQMQALHAEKERADRRVEDMRVTMGKGKWVERASDSAQLGPRLLYSHVPYQEYLAFISHLRSVRPTSQHPPAMSTLLPLPFLARLVTEDSDPTVRLDLAPSLNWLTRRSVISAIHSGQLTVEPMATASLLEELAPSSIPGNAHNTHLSCALCGTSIFSPANPDSPSVASTPALSSRPSMQHGTWSSSLFKNSIVQSISTANPGILTNHRALPYAPAEIPTQVYIFRLASTSSSGLPVSLPLSSQPNSAQGRPTIYPLCTTKWCLARLRTTCTLWAFVRTSIVEKVWEEGAYIPPARHSPKGSINGVEKHDMPNGFSDAEKKPIPPRRSRMGIGALWGSMQRSLSNSREFEKEPALAKPADTEKEKPLPRDPSKRYPLPPPIHPSLSAPARTASAPPPLPKRSRGRDAQLKTIVLPVEHAEGDGVAAPPLERQESTDQYLTPIDEPSSLTPPRPSSPSTVPLPDSSPSTPEPKTASASASDESQRISTDIPTSDVHPMPSLASVDDETVTPSRGASPVPPPLPRRAAARPRPVSVVAPPPEQPSAEGAASTSDNKEDEGAAAANNEASENKLDEATAPAPEEHPPAPESENTESAEPTEQVQANGEDGEEASHSEGERAAEAHAAEEAADSEPAPEPSEESPEEQPASEEPREASPGEEQAEEAVAGDDVADASGAAVGHEGSPEPSDDAAPSSVALSTNGVVDGIEGQSIRSRDYGERADADAAKSVSEFSAEEDAGLYVGDATWEERTWKELVRLREEMFWARIGGVR